MTLVEWNNDLAVNVSFIDSEHKEMVVLINELHEAILAEQSKQDLDRRLDRLIAHVAAHFNHEEILFESTGYADAVKHKKQHDALAKQILQLQIDYRQGDADLPVDVLKLICKWLLHHIRTTDRKYGLHLDTRTGVARVEDAEESPAFQAFAA